MSGGGLGARAALAAALVAAVGAAGCGERREAGPAPSEAAAPVPSAAGTAGGAELPAPSAAPGVRDDREALARVDLIIFGMT